MKFRTALPLYVTLNLLYGCAGFEMPTLPSSASPAACTASGRTISVGSLSCKAGVCPSGAGNAFKDSLLRQLHQTGAYRVVERGGAELEINGTLTKYRGPTEGSCGGAKRYLPKCRTVITMEYRVRDRRDGVIVDTSIVDNEFIPLNIFSTPTATEVINSLTEKAVKNLASAECASQ